MSAATSTVSNSDEPGSVALKIEAESVNPVPEAHSTSQINSNSSEVKSEHVIGSKNENKIEKDGHDEGEIPSLIPKKAASSSTSPSSEPNSEEGIAAEPPERIVPTAHSGTIEVFDKDTGLSVNMRPRVFFDIAVNGALLSRVVIELFADLVPATVENFRALCVGGLAAVPEGGGAPLSYVSSGFHRVKKGFMIQGGDVTEGDGSGGASIYGPTFKDESFGVEGGHSGPGVVAMANAGPNTNSSQFYILTAPNGAKHLDEKHVVFGRVVAGMETVRIIEASAVDARDKPFAAITITKAGQLGLAVPPEVAIRAAKRVTRRRVLRAGGLDPGVHGMPTGSTSTSNGHQAPAAQKKQNSTDQAEDDEGDGSGENGEDKDRRRRRRKKRRGESSRGGGDGGEGEGGSGRRRKRRRASSPGRT